MWNRILDEVYEWTLSILFLGGFVAVVSAVFMFITSF
jgi:hypothetical protein